MFGGKTILKWREPRFLLRQHERELSLPQRLWFRHKAPFLGGLLIGAVIVATNGGLPENFREWQFALGLSLVMGLSFAFIYGLAALLPQHVYLMEKCVIRTHGESVERWNYDKIEKYEITELLLEDYRMRLLKIYKLDGDEIGFEISEDVTDQAIRKALDGKIGTTRIAA